MALKDIFSLFDDALESVFHTKAYDPTTDRQKMAARIDKTKDKFLATEPQKGRKDFSIGNNVVAFSPTAPSGHPLVLNGKTTNFIPAERFPDALDKLKAAVLAGDLDDALKAEGSPTIPPKARAARKPREGGGGAGWSDERRAKFAATVAARNAAKGA